MKRKSFTEAFHEVMTGPWIFVAAGLVYLLLSFAAIADPAVQTGNSRMSAGPLTAAVFLFGLASFAVGIKTADYALRLSYAPVITAVILAAITSYFVLGMNPALSVVFSLAVLLASLILVFSKLKWEWVFSAGAVCIWSSYLVNGLPILDISMHQDLFKSVNPVFVTGFFLMTYALARMYPKRRYLWIFALASLALSSFRLYLGISFMTWVILEMRQSRPGMKRFLSVMSAAVVILIVSAVMGQYIMASKSDWSLDAFRTAEHRMAFTMSVFDDIVSLSFPLGYVHGETIRHEFTEYTCRLLYGYDDRITSTAFGEAMLNFGIPAVFLVAWWCGALLANIRRKDYAVFAVLTAVMLGTLDVGINIIIITGFIYIGWLRVVAK